MQTRAPAENPLVVIPDGVLIQQSLAGNQDAFEALVHRYKGMLFYVIYPCLRDYHESQDIVQDVFFQLYRSLDTIRLDGSLKAWLFKVAHNRCLDQLRRKRPTYFSEVGLDNEEDEDSPLDALVDIDPLPEEQLEQREQAKRLHLAIRELPAKYRLVVALRFETKMSYQAIGRALNIPESTVKTQLHRAKRLLRVSKSVLICYQ